MNEGVWLNRPKNKIENKKEYSELDLPVVRRGVIDGANISFVECEKEGTGWKNLLEKQKKNFIEIGGPSSDFSEDEIINFNDFKDRTICTNIKIDSSLKNKNNEIAGIKNYADVIADATNLQYKDGTFGALFARKFRMEESKRKMAKPETGKPDVENNEYIKKVISEAHRVLDEGGLVVWLDMEEDAFNEIIKGGFEPIFYQKREYKNGKRYQAVFQKKD